MSESISGSIRTLAALLEARTGQQLAMSRAWRIETSLRPLMRERGLATSDQLVSALISGREPALGDLVVEALLNNETFFFRDHALFQLVNSEALELLRGTRQSKKRLRIWCAGCSTGQEAYSLAMMIADDSVRWSGWAVDIVATDVSGGAIERARSGIFSQFEIQRGLPIMMMMRWFDQDGETWHAKPELKKMVQFRRHNILDKPSFPGRFDLVLCRNVLLYFPVPVRTAAFERLSGVIEPDGVLMLGAGETVLGQTTKFISERELRGLYRPAPVASSRSSQAA